MKGKKFIISFIPIIVGLILAYTMIFIGYDMEHAWWVSIVVSIIGVIGTLIAVLIQLRRDGKTIDKIDDRSISIPNINENSKKTKDVLIEKISPQVDRIADRNEKIDYIAKEFEYQQRIKESVSNGGENRDVMIESIKAMFEENARLNAMLRESQQRVVVLRAEKQSLTAELQECRSELKKERLKHYDDNSPSIQRGRGFDL